MYSFKNDYSEGAHPNILKALIEHNNAQEEGYGLDRHTQNAIFLLRNLVGDSQADVHLLSGGTQTNLIAISSFLRPHEACITVSSGHIASHEAGAIEATGHKLLTVNSSDGKIAPELIEPVLTDHHFEHMVKPRLVYISNPTELGTVYSKSELQSLYAFCQAKNLLLYADGARLGSALVSKGGDATFEDMYKLTDAFFIGGTKNGALLGEALVIKNSQLRADFRYLTKQRGGLLAKGRVLGIQFEELFKDTLYFDLAQHANEMAQFVAKEIVKTGCTVWIDSPTNQIFPIIDNRIIEELSRKFQFYVWAKTDEGHSAIRLVTSWATSQQAVQSFVDEYRQASKNLLGPE
ncbi:MAG: aminotransferase class I/II-fold pyridoxal phosphate-dependent enzyme [Desulfobulbaceae bacterium]|nr:aminotransferase class I/II-fold pyridoxal phosphate-dependent enzyme [Desulfobulbaceae bacterium]